MIEDTDIKGAGMQVNSAGITMLLSIESHGVFSFIGLGAFQLTASAVSWGGGSMSIKALQTDSQKATPFVCR